ncbi:WD40-repeat-containing domain protein [Gaertneriomyces semiglobifer]|nr:WD40-repeat-containing domain protein [Gaertneriomyces semiglobifer]
MAGDGTPERSHPDDRQTPQHQEGRNPPAGDVTPVRQSMRSPVSFRTPAIPATPRKRVRHVDMLHGDDDRITSYYDRFATIISPSATPRVRKAARLSIDSSPGSSQSTDSTSSSLLPTPTSVTSPFATALGLPPDERILQVDSVRSPKGRQSREETVWERLNRTPTQPPGTASLPQTPRSLTRPPRVIPKAAERVLDAPQLKNDYYINVLDWSVNGVVAVGLNNQVYLWSEETAEVHEIWKVAEPDYVTACCFSPDGTRVAVGSEEGSCEIISVPKHDFKAGKCKARIMHHNGVAALTWCKKDEQVLLATGDRLGVIRVYDTTVRRNDENASSRSSRFRTHCEMIREWRGFHEDRIVGLKWSPDSRLLASGGNDNLVCLWQLDRPDSPKVIIREHRSAVRALAWCPWDPILLATGGGWKIRVFGSITHKVCIKKKEISTGSQVCALIWSKSYKELVSTHNSTGDQIIVWSYPSMAEVARLSGHQQRPLFLAMSPNGESIVTGAGDENLKFWKIFPMKEGQRFLKPREEEMSEERLSVP